MPTTIEDFQRELYQLFAQAGEKQYMIKAFRKQIEEQNNELNTINQKIERTQVAFRALVAKKGKEQQGQLNEALPTDQPTETSSNAV